MNVSVPLEQPRQPRDVNDQTNNVMLNDEGEEFDDLQDAALLEDITSSWYLVVNDLRVLRSTSKLQQLCCRETPELVVNNVSFSAKSGEVVAVVGAANSGYDALIHATAGQLPPAAVRGKIWAVAPAKNKAGCGNCKPICVSLRATGVEEPPYFSSLVAQLNQSDRTHSVASDTTLQSSVGIPVLTNATIPEAQLPGSHKIKTGNSSHAWSFSDSSFCSEMRYDEEVKRDVENVSEEQNKKKGFAWVNRQNYVVDFSLLSFVGTLDRHLLPNLTVEESFRYAVRLCGLRLTKKSRETLIDGLISRIGLKHCRHRRIGSVGDKILSTGERRRVAIGIELLNFHKQFFVLDDPTSSLDSVEAENILRLLATLAHKEKKCVLFSASNPNAMVLSHVDKLILVHEGSIVYKGAPHDLSNYLVTHWGWSPETIEKNPVEQVLRFFTSEQSSKQNALLALKPSSSVIATDEATPRTALTSNNDGLSEKGIELESDFAKLEAAPSAKTTERLALLAEKYAEKQDENKLYCTVPPSFPPVKLKKCWHESRFLTSVIVLTSRFFRNAVRSPVVLLPILMALFQGLLLGSIMYQYPSRLPPKQNVTNVVSLFPREPEAWEGVTSVANRLKNDTDGLTQVLYQYQYGVGEHNRSIVHDFVNSSEFRDRMLRYLDCLYTGSKTDVVYGPSFFGPSLGSATPLQVNDAQRYLYGSVQGGRLLHRLVTQMRWKEMAKKAASSLINSPKLLPFTVPLLRLGWNCSLASTVEIKNLHKAFHSVEGSPWWYAGNKQVTPISNNVCPSNVSEVTLEAFLKTVEQQGLWENVNSTEYQYNQREAEAILRGLLGYMNPIKAAALVFDPESKGDYTQAVFVPQLLNIQRAVVQVLTQMLRVPKDHVAYDLRYLVAKILSVIQRIKYRFIDTYMARFFISSWTSLTTTGAIFCLVAALGMSAITAVFSFHEHRVLFNKETANGMYTPLAYFIARLLSDALFQIASASFLAGATTALGGFGVDPVARRLTWHFVIHLLMCNLLSFTLYGFGYMISAATPRVEVGVVVAPFVLLTWLMLAGFILRDDSSLMLWCRWFRYSAPQRYGFFALMQYYFQKGGYFGDVPNALVRWVMGVPQEDYFAYNLFVLASLGIGFRAVGFLFLTFAYRRVGVVDRSTAL